MTRNTPGFFIASLMTLFVISAGSVSAQNSSNTAELPASAPMALMQASYLGHHQPASILNLTVVLKLRNTQQLHQFLRTLRDPVSPEYRHFLTPQQFNMLYGPTADEANSVVGYLEGQGLQVTGFSPDHKLIFVTAQSGTIERAFGIHINDYEYEGRRVHATVDNPKFPDAIANVVEAVLGLNNVATAYSALVLPVNTMLSPGSSTPIGYSPLQLATAYNWPSLTNASIGAGVTIAVASDDSPGVQASDYTTFWSYYGLPNHTVTFTNIGGNPPENYSHDEEATLDVEHAGAMAPGAAIHVYDANVPTSDSTISAFEVWVTMFDAIVNDNPQVLTISYLFKEADLLPSSQNTTGELQAADNEFMQGTAQGMAVIAADGDWGSSFVMTPPCDYTGNVPLYPAADPYVLAAGGTTLTLNGNNTIASETAWSYGPYNNNSECLGTGGAVSNYVASGATYWAEPGWQKGEGVPQNGYRNYSDMSMDADPNTPQSLYFLGGWQSGGGGTSFVAPELAGLIADEISLAGSSNRLAQVNSAIYIDANNYYSTDFHDITSGSNGAYSAGPGWDYPTGWGSPNAINLIDHLSSGAAISDPQNLGAEYLGCRMNRDKYFVTWQKPQIGTASGGYDLEYEIPGQTNWHSIAYGPGLQANINLPPSTQVGLRVRASNGRIWSTYNTIMFTTSVCSPPP